MRGRRLGATALTAGLALLAACSSGSTGSGESGASGSSPPARTSPASASRSAPLTGNVSASGLPTPDHVMVVVFENEDATNVLGTSDAPYLTSLAAAGANFTDAHALTHPSQPNYLALFSGSTHGVTDDACPQALSGSNLASELRAAGRTFVGYSEDMPSAGYTGCSAGDYARKHNPWVNFADLPSSVNQPLTALPNVWSSLPTVSFVVPNLCNDMHDCSVATGDRWARAHLSDYVAWATAHNSLLVVTFDEDSGSSNNHIATTVVGAGVHAGQVDSRIDHYTVLRTITDMYGLTPLGEAAQQKSITGIWTP